MLRKKRYIIGFAVAVGIAMFIIGIIGVQFPRSLLVTGCPEGTVPTHHAGECRPLLPIETDETFPWDKQQAEAQDFFRQFQTGVAADRREEVVSMMMYPLRVTFYNDPKPADYRFLQSPDELLDVYDKVFHKSVVNYITSYDANEVWGNDYFLQTGTGQIGISCTTLGDCPECSFEFKVKVIRGNSIYRDTVEDIFGNPIKPSDTQ